MADATRALKVVAAVALVSAVAGCGHSVVESCATVAEDARDAAIARFDAHDPALLSFANIINRPSRRLEIGRLAFEDSLAACRLDADRGPLPA